MRTKYPWGATFYGDKGTRKASVMSERHVAPAIRGHMKNFLESIASRGTPVADIEQGYMSAAACVLANHSLTLGRSLHWNHAKGQVVGAAEANKLLRRTYRAPWVHPDPASV